MRVTKRRFLLGVAGVLTSMMIAAPAAAAGAAHGTVDVNDVTGGTHGGLVQGSDGGERNINFFNSATPSGSTGNRQGAFYFEEALEFNSNVGSPLRYVTYDEKELHP
jgi:hypothetical protein